MKKRLTALFFIINIILKLLNQIVLFTGVPNENVENTIHKTLINVCACYNYINYQNFVIQLTANISN